LSNSTWTKGGFGTAGGGEVCLQPWRGLVVGGQAGRDVIAAEEDLEGAAAANQASQSRHWAASGEGADSDHALLQWLAAIDLPVFPATGTVVTEMKTPDRWSQGLTRQHSAVLG